ncbi:MAG: hypothetical protein P9L88_07885 [Candidatus Tantalella remota]|nr:hypothetical protein [Candidatus Tantalella remota]
MEFVCPTCGKKMPRELLEIIPHTEEHIIEAIKKEHPRWVEEDGACGKCHAHYKDQMDPDVQNNNGGKGKFNS